MKLIFLDVDGVLNRVQTKTQAPSGCTGIETELVKNLAKIVNETNALIILTSDWKVEWETVSFCCSEDVMDHWTISGWKCKKDGMKTNLSMNHVYNWIQIEEIINCD